MITNRWGNRRFLPIKFAVGSWSHDLGINYIHQGTFFNANEKVNTNSGTWCVLFKTKIQCLHKINKPCQVLRCSDFSPLQDLW